MSRSRRTAVTGEAAFLRYMRARLLAAHSTPIASVTSAAMDALSLARCCGPDVGEPEPVRFARVSVRGPAGDAAVWQNGPPFTSKGRAGPARRVEPRRVR